jgi:hypothetical protein
MNREPQERSRSMDSKSTPTARAFLGVLALVFVGVAIWAATALSAGGSSSTPGPSSSAPATTVLSPVATGEECPEDGDGGDSGSSGGATLSF